MCIRDSPYITHFHIGNAVVKEGCEAYGDQHPRFGFPESANDTEQLLSLIHISGVLCTQGWPWSMLPVWRRFFNSARGKKPLWARTR